MESLKLGFKLLFVGGVIFAMYKYVQADKEIRVQLKKESTEKIVSAEVKESLVDSSQNCVYLDGSKRGFFDHEKKTNSETVFSLVDNI